MEINEKRGAVGGSDVLGNKDNERSRKSRTAISQPNFLNPHPPRKEDIVKQDIKLILKGKAYWNNVVQEELDRNKAVFKSVKGARSIICLDISESMTEAWTEAHTFLTDYLEGLEKMSKYQDLKTEHVALLTFGHETKIQMAYTDRLYDVRKKLDGIKLGGPTQMYGGIMVARAAAIISEHHLERLSNDAPVYTKVIMVTDGRPTELNLFAGPDIPNNNKLDETKAEILQQLERLRPYSVDVYFVPVGSSDMEFIDTMVICSNGILLDYRQGNRLSRRQSLMAQLLNPLQPTPYVQLSGSITGLSEDDKEDIMNIKGRIRKQPNPYFESKSKQLPLVGSRVRRDPDWKEDMDDSNDNGPGTVIGHCRCENHIYVEWDADGYLRLYTYKPNAYEVFVVDEPRGLKPDENIAVGCEVKPGKDWMRLEGKMNTGVVIKLDRKSKKAQVRWNTGKRGDYSYGGDGIQEIEVITRIRFFLLWAYFANAWLCDCALPRNVPLPIIF
ncbi:uncharacterized protein LOC123554780 isoform X2 [Mercenaria mercenaria]|uniref:uncharacterized protein LOC123554780 isoform X2 n=1 Tax=Mercenaria mercenaria TaxID=6596 RepID=UPI001E1D40DB|nr:uncharacterized protein LOC123554780 isoform X2 [Mercenaria mercenaria]